MGDKAPRPGIGPGFARSLDVSRRLVDGLESVIRGKREVLEHHFSYTPNDLVVVEWNAAFVYEPTGSEDVVDLLEIDAVVACLEAVHAGLEPGGLFVFDVCTERNSLRYFSQFREREAGPGFAYQRHGYYDAASRMQMNDSVIHREGHRTPLHELHRQRIYRLDEIDAAIIGPGHYRDFIKPFEEDLARFHDRISYWHSCGNTARVAKEVVAIGRIDVLDVSGYTDLEKVLCELDSGAPRLDIRLHPLRDLQDATPEWMETRMAHVIDLCRRHGVESMSIRVSGLNPWKSPEEDFQKIRAWIEMARRVINRH